MFTKKMILEEKDRFRIEKIFENLKMYDEKNLKKVEKTISNSMTSAEKKKLFVFLVSCFLETDFIKWDAVKTKISALINSVNNKGKSENNSNEEKEYAELYINIGKDKRVFPRDLIAFIRSSMKVDHTDIKNIRIHDKYSFFQIPKDIGDKAIILLSVKRFRGKNIVVNFSKHEQ